ncbi:hypothetical protein HZC35_06790 [Candidatus Saganbacteria bacterium]|nr:hypothetical protein [Candidatus Saganbacteria bacterium]
MVELGRLESSMARFTGVGALRRGVGLCRADGSGSVNTPPQINVLGLLIMRPTGKWEVSPGNLFVKFKDRQGEAGVIIENRYWKSVPRNIMERILKVDSLMWDIISGKDMIHYYLPENIPSMRMFGVDLFPILNLRDIDKGDSPEKDVLEILTALGARDGRKIVEGVPSSFSKYGHSFSEIGQLKQSVMSTWAKHGSSANSVLRRNLRLNVAVP